MRGPGFPRVRTGCRKTLLFQTPKESLQAIPYARESVLFVWNGRISLAYLPYSFSKGISLPPDGMEELSGRRCIDLFSQMIDVHINDICPRIELISPNLLTQVLTGE